MNQRSTLPKLRTKQGSVLIMVLWVLVMIGYLTEQYLVHNRGKAGLAANAWNSLNRKHAIESVLHLFATDSWPFPEHISTDSTWFHLNFEDLDVWVREEKESNKINLNSEAEFKIRETILKILGDDRRDESDMLADAIFDWRDNDTLVRTNGAEAEYYNDLDFPYTPANGPFKIFTELLLVKGMTTELFWGDPLRSIEYDADNPETEADPHSFADDFTIYSKDVKRVSIIIQDGQTNLFVLSFLEKKSTGWKMMRMYQTLLVS